VEEIAFNTVIHCVPWITYVIVIRDYDSSVSC